jgi:hypothetical protein
VTSLPPIKVGSQVIAKRASGVNAPGERGVCYEVYQLGGRPGYSFIFERGRYDGFSPQDVEMFLHVTGQHCPAVADYQFANVTRLARDFEQGRFAEAFPPLKTYTGYRLPGKEVTAAKALVTVHQQGQPPRPLDPRLDLRMHADSFNWGYAGSGPAQLALALAADVLGDDDAAQEVHQKLKNKVIAALPKDGWSLSETQLRLAFADIQQQRGRGRSP